MAALLLGLRVTLVPSRRVGCVVASPARIISQADGALGFLAVVRMQKADTLLTVSNTIQTIPAT
ncbi:hypothetical protein H257_07528 [Aphanomyces astaci]|uniref:Secreted protein n=1 Tax=Aphanomyces astaci TaxID=112090 RepID=W4GI15_APHAT|nr:hypothetical protein H257_07528 [Aphanomyces astaci]ETV78674.1 hypothetical protein H257_07528 [Aphanomyces astaci]|eukprot:XP_009831393.1 hypothetical protein H257_07528 [Aphanomyces astaci]